ncbi:MAG: NfeD family protein [Bacilli bacterium]
MVDFTLIAFLWLFIIIVLLIIEAVTINLVTLWFAIAAIPSFIISLYSNNIILQIAIFIAISIVLLIATKPFVKKIHHGKTIKTNYERVVGEQAIALDSFGGIETGYVKVNGLEWLAQSNEEIVKGDIITIKDVSGAKVTVEKK